VVAASNAAAIIIRSIMILISFLSSVGEQSRIPADDGRGCESVGRAAAPVRLFGASW
jgi:hypothetical protein